MNEKHSGELLVLPRKLGWGWRLNWKHRLAWPFLIFQIVLIAVPLAVLRYAGVTSDEAFGACALATIGVSAWIWFVLARREV